ncbi:MAG: hypothetical protein MI919_18080, partial [Holophagales bacterium]|nr:hypothetical protein [Holophagales bacterium]
MPTRTERSRSLSGQVLLALSVLGLFVTAGCRSPMRPPDLRGIYDRAAKLHHVDRNPVVVVPGILGTRLVDTDSGRVVWGAFGGGSADPSKAQGARLVALPMEPGRPLAELRDNVAVDGVLESLRVRLLGLPLELQAYVDILRTPGA